MSCKGKCEKYKAPPIGYNARYSNGQKRCQICDIYIIWDENKFCPCCGYLLRTKPRIKRLRESYNEKQQVMKRIS